MTTSDLSAGLFPCLPPVFMVICIHLEKEAASMSAIQSLLSAIFSDETPFFRFPSEPDPGQTVTVRLRVAKGSSSRAS